MVKRRIIFKVISKRKVKTRKGLSIAKILRKQGFKNAQITDFKTVGKGSKIRGRGTIVLAFKGRKKTPKGFRTKLEKF